MNNQVNFIGFIGKDPQLVSFTDSNDRVAKFSIAVRDYYSKTENPEPMWINVDAWNGLADRVMAIVTTGREVAISGRLEMSSYDKEINGVKVKMKESFVKLSGFHLCGPKPKEENAAEKKPVRSRRRSAA